MELAAPVFDAWIASTIAVHYRPTLLLGLWSWESNNNPDAVGDCALSKDDLLTLYHTHGLDAARATKCSCGLGQINAINWTETLNPDALSDPMVNGTWSGAYLDTLYQQHGADERLACAAYRGPGIVERGGGWEWDAPRTNWIIARANALDAEGVTRKNGAGPTPPAPAPPAGGQSSAAVNVQISAFTLRSIVEDLTEIAERLRAAILAT